MINLKFNSRAFEKEMNSVFDYAAGFMEGAQAGKQELLRTIGDKTVEILNEYIDSNARVNQTALHHIYEWYQTGSPNARLFDIDYFTSGGGLTVRSNFRQSTSVQNGSTTPFYDKARLMEQGLPVVIRPRRAQTLVFEQDGETVFTKQPVTVSNPGGESVQGAFKQVIDTFFNTYWTQSFLKSSGIADILNNPIAFKQNLPRAKAGGRAKGYDVGYRWISAKGVA